MEANVEFVAYSDMSQRVNTIEQLLARISSLGLDAQIVHPSEKTVRELDSVLLKKAMSTHTLRYAPIEADCIVLVDGDLVTDKRTLDRLDQLVKPVFVVVPQPALPAVLPQTLRDLVRSVELYPAIRGDEDYPRTFGCNHTAETCFNCEWLVAQWKADRRDQEARKLVLLD